MPKGIYDDSAEYWRWQGLTQAAQINQRPWQANLQNQAAVQQARQTMQDDQQRWANQQSPAQQAQQLADMVTNGLISSDNVRALANAPDLAAYAAAATAPEPAPEEPQLPPKTRYEWIGEDFE